MSTTLERPRARRAWSLPQPLQRWTALPELPFRTSARPGRRVSVPTVLQMEALECGAATLAMVLAHHGRWVPLEELRVACGVSRDGSKASNILRAARSYGLTARGFKKEPGELAGLPLPAIIHWNFNHFVVLEGIRGGRVYLNDPARGPRVVTEAEFDQAFTGVVLTFEPAESFERGGSPPSLTGSLVPRLSGSYAGLAFVVLAGLALVVPGLVAPTFTRVFVDDVLVKGALTWLRPLLFLMAVTAVLLAGLTWLQHHYLLRLESKVALSTSSRFFWHVLQLPIGFFSQRYVGEIGNRVGINDRVARLLSGELATTVLGVLMIAFYGVLMIQYDVVLTALSVVLVSLNLLALRYMSKRRTVLNQRLLQDRGKLMGVAMGGLQTIETLKATGAEADFFARWSGHQAKAINAGQQLGYTTQLLGAVPPFLLAVNTSLILGIGGLRVMDGHLTMGMLIAFQALMLAFMAPVNKMVHLGATLQEVRGDMNRLDDVLRARPDPIVSGGAPGADPAGPANTAGPAAAPKLEGQLELRSISFGYSPLDPPLLQEFSLDLRPGSRVALVGGSGCGKSTISRLVSGLFEPWEGEIRFDGRPRAEYARGVVTSSVALVDQDVFLFEGTVRENLTLWDETVSEADLIQAARDACIHDDIVARPGGYNGHVEEGGRNFSGGQRQRMEIARALVGNPRLMILDEATSALDPLTEVEVDDNLRRRGCTCLLVAHRLSTIRDCDEIIVLEKGRVVQRGTHASMIAVPGPYRDLIEAD